MLMFCVLRAPWPVRTGSRLPQCVVESLFSSDYLAGCGPAAAYLSTSLTLCFLRTTLPGAARQPLTFLVSPRKAKQKKATARSRPLRGSQRCAVENGRVANSLRSNMRPSYPFSTAHHWPGSKRIRFNCSLRIALLAQYCRLAAVVDHYR